MRTFIAIELDPALCGRLELEVNRLRAMAVAARWVRRDSLHLTLSFLGEIADAAAPQISEVIAQVASRHRPVQLSVRGAGTFGPLDWPRVLWVALTGEQVPGLLALQNDLSKQLAALGHPPDFERFEPHVTLARSKNPRGDPALARCARALGAEPLGSLAVREVVLFSSETHRDGMRYAPVSRHPLQSGQ